MILCDSSFVFLFLSVVLSVVLFDVVLDVSSCWNPVAFSILSCIDDFLLDVELDVVFLVDFVEVVAFFIWSN